MRNPASTTRCGTWLYLRQTEADEDAYITELIKVAREMCEEYQRRSYIETAFDFWLRRFPRGDEIILPRSPLRIVSQLSFFTPDDAETVVDASVFNVDDVTKPGRLVRGFSQIWPSATLRTSKGVKVSFTAGHGTLAADVPARMKHAIKLTIANFFEERQPILTGTIADERRHVGFGENRIGSLIREFPERKPEIEQMQKEMTYHMLATFADAFRDREETYEEARRVLGTGEGEGNALWHGANLAVLEPREMEHVLADTVLKEFKVRLGRIGLEYQSPATPKAA